MVSQEPRVMVFEKQITIIKIILSTNFDDLIIEISDIIILIIQISFRKNQSVVLFLPKVEFLIFSPIFFNEVLGSFAALKQMSFMPNRRF